MNIYKTLRFAETVMRSKFGNLSHPYKLNFAVTYWCQSKCVMCNIWEMKPINELTYEEIQSFAEANPYFKWVQLTGGEPFIRKDLVKIAEAFKMANKNLFILAMPTNSLCDSDMVRNKVKDIMELGIPHVAITLSLDGDEETHDYVRGIKGNYNKVITNYMQLKDIQIRYPNLFIDFGYTITKWNLGKFEKTLESVRFFDKDITANDFHINLGQLSSNYYTNTSNVFVVDDKEALIAELKYILAQRTFKLNPVYYLEDLFTRKLLQFIETGVSPVPNRGLDLSVFMDSYGNIFPSIMSNQKIHNIRDTNYKLTLPQLDKFKVIEPPNFTSCEAYQAILGD